MKSGKESKRIGGGGGNSSSSSSSSSSSKSKTTYYEMTMSKGTGRDEISCIYSFHLIHLWYDE